MPTTEELKEKARAEIDQRGEELIRVAKTILENPEPGFREENIWPDYRRYGGA